MRRLSNPLIQQRGNDGVYITDGQLVCYRWIPDMTALGMIQTKLEAAGLPTDIELTDDLSEYGVLVQ